MKNKLKFFLIIGLTFLTSLFIISCNEKQVTNKIVDQNNIQKNTDQENNQDKKISGDKKENSETEILKNDNNSLKDNKKQEDQKTPEKDIVEPKKDIDTNKENSENHNQNDQEGKQDSEKEKEEKTSLSQVNHENIGQQITVNALVIAIDEKNNNFKVYVSDKNGQNPAFVFLKGEKNPEFTVGAYLSFTAKVAEHRGNLELTEPSNINTIKQKIKLPKKLTSLTKEQLNDPKNQNKVIDLVDVKVEQEERNNTHSNNRLAKGKKKKPKKNRKNKDKKKNKNKNNNQNNNQNFKNYYAIIGKEKVSIYYLDRDLPGIVTFRDIVISKTNNGKIVLKMQSFTKIEHSNKMDDEIADQPIDSEPRNDQPRRKKHQEDGVTPDDEKDSEKIEGKDKKNPSEKIDIDPNTLTTISEYYKDINYNTDEKTFFNSLNKLISRENKTSYDTVYTELNKSDIDPKNPSKLLGIYDSKPLQKGLRQGNVWNREHVWPKSKLNGASKSDFHNLRASDTRTNSNRGNLNFVDGSGKNKKVGNGYYPGDEHKGDVARILLYMAVRYQDRLKLHDNPRGNQMGNLSVLYKWHQEDPVSQFEINRNNHIYKIQRNRNPFIDHPEWFEKVWNYLKTN